MSVRELPPTAAISTQPEIRSPGATIVETPIVIVPRHDSSTTLDLEPIFLHSMNAETFRAMDGNLQEFALLDRMRAGDLGKVNEWRPDFRIWEPLTPRQQVVAESIDQVTKSEKPVKGSYGIDAFGKIWSHVIVDSPSASMRDVEQKLEETRQRRIAHVGEPNSMFYTNYEGLAGISAGILYRSQLDKELKREQAEIAGVETVTTEHQIFPEKPTIQFTSYYEADSSDNPTQF